MDLRAALLIGGSLLCLLPAVAVAATGCLRCHPVHYATTGDCSRCHRGDARSNRPQIAHHDLIPGRFAHFAMHDSPITAAGGKVLETAGCRRCHVSGGKGNRLATNLDLLLQTARPEETLASIIQPVLFMPDFAFTEETATSLVNVLFAGSLQTETSGGEVPLIVHFEELERQENAFQKSCGGCHRVFTKELGGLGKGNIGPNLAGLLTEFYPFPFKEGENWTTVRLTKWLENPRAIRPQARMRPIKLTPEEIANLLEIFQLPDAPSPSLPEKPVSN